MPRRPAPPLKRCAQHGIAGIGRDIKGRAIGLGLFRRQPFIINAVQTICMNMSLKALNIMHIMRQHHHAAFGIHGVIVELLAQPIPKLHRMIIKMRAFIIEIVGSDDRCVPPCIAAADPAFLQDRNIGDPIFLGEIISRAQTMPAAADDNRVIAWLGGSIGPLFRPALMPAQGLREKTKRTETGHAPAPTNGA